jgi:hypothetical protein
MEGEAVVRRFLLWALERWTGDRYVSEISLREAADTTGPIHRAGSHANALDLIEDAIRWARAREGR